MKKVTLIMFVAVIGILSANAQFYLGGSLDFKTKTEKPKGGAKSTQSQFSIAPDVGYSLNQDLDLGIALGFNNEKDISSFKTSSWGISPYARYSFVEFGRFSVWGQAALFVGGSKMNKLKTKSTSFGLTLSPVLKYSLSKQFDLTTGLNFFNIGFSRTATKVNGKKQGTDTSFGLGMDTGDIATLGNVSIGFAYKF
ncbi:MAG: hypothetical protein LBJ60_04305 [Tannerellaceae bacterium]|jgi:hypothetical protein|nr:hypothetical protein [Tannerellaceae bacterium]